MKLSELIKDLIDQLVQTDEVYLEHKGLPVVRLWVRLKDADRAELVVVSDVPDTDPPEK